MQTLGNVTCVSLGGQYPFDDVTNMATFWNAVRVLFVMFTSAGWARVGRALMQQPPDCDLHSTVLPDATVVHDVSGCGAPVWAAIYCVSFVLFAYILIGARASRPRLSASAACALWPSKAQPRQISAATSTSHSRILGRPVYQYAHRAL